MVEPTLADVVKRLEAVEHELSALRKRPRPKDWRRVVGMFAGSEFMKQLDADVATAREAEREAARQGDPE
jgi:hypothetical protein